MKIKFLITTVAACCLLQTAFGQGALTPPGAPAPTMKSLAQIEPRTPISTMPFTISQPGSYYLTGNLTGVSGAHGITISSGNVTLDLNGFSLTGVLGSYNGVAVSGTFTNITVRNGSVSGWGFSGVEGNLSGAPRNELFEQLTSSGNGQAGISVNSSSLVRGCLSYANGGTGVSCLHGKVCDCTIRGGNSVGIYIVSGIVSGCLVENNARSGIYIDGPGSTVIGNACNGNNSGLNSVDAGILINDGNNRIEDNNVISNSVAGISAASGYFHNVVIKNTVTGTNNFVGTAGNDFGPIGTAASATSPWANISH